MALSAITLYAFPIGWALLVWWLSTGVIIYLDNLPRPTHRWSMLGATAILLLALHGLHTGSADTSVAGAYSAFTYALLAWGWHEMSFFMGFITGPNRSPCPPDCTGWPRFTRAVRVVIHHELVSLASALAIIAATADGPNQVGTWTFLVLWWMRLSSKFNVFLGVRNISAEFIPEHLAHIRSFLRERPMNLLFPVSVTVSTVIAAQLVRQIAASTDPVSITGTLFVTVLLILAIIEHWFLVLPLPVAALWNWSISARQKQRAASDAEHAARRHAPVSAVPPARLSLVPATLPIAITIPSEATHEL